MIFMPAVGQHPLLEIDAERGPKQGALDIVNGHGVTGKQEVDVSPIDQLLEVLSRPRMDHRRAGDDK